MYTIQGPAGLPPTSAKKGKGGGKKAGKVRIPFPGSSFSLVLSCHVTAVCHVTIYFSGGNGGWDPVGRLQD